MIELVLKCCGRWFFRWRGSQYRDTYATQVFGKFDPQSNGVMAHARRQRVKEESDEEPSPRVQSSPESDVRRRLRRISREEND